MAGLDANGSRDCAAGHLALDDPAANEHDQQRHQNAAAGAQLIDSNAVTVLSDWINSLPGTPALAPPTITPNGGLFYNNVGVTLQSTNANAAIYYTLDGSTPTTNSLLYSGPFNLTSNATVSASAFETNYVNSAPASALFVVLPVQFLSESFSNGVFRLQFLGSWAAITFCRLRPIW